ncbi:MAG: DUF937 domain-containing protein [Rhodospirillales bacterium]|jgi:uncharacterized protein YidB (DUF937 family)|nr:DUF937 domain-containing protein [Rhodospirillales bacterium]
MGLFDEISGLVGSALGAEAGGGESAVTAALQAAGIPGITGIVQQLQQSGLAAQAASWIGTGANQPVSAAEIEQALGGPVLTAIAGHLGVDPSAASALLSRVLPGLVDRQTPNGTLQTADASDDAGSEEP